MGKSSKRAANSDAIRGIQRGLDEMKAGRGKPFRVALDEIRAEYKIPRRQVRRVRLALGEPESAEE